MSATLTLLERIGQGGAGAVFRASMTDRGGLERRVAVKVLGGEPTEADLALLRTEAEALARVPHRAVVRVIGLDRVGGRWALIMELIEGADLAQLLALGPAPPGAALEIVAEVAGALHAAWLAPDPSGQPARLIHRDLKPANLRLSRFGELRVLDWGLARAQGGPPDAAGTEGYMAPERAQGREGPASDVYALGAVLYELLAGRPLGRCSSRAAAHDHRLRAALARLDAPHLPEETRGLLAAMLAFEPEDRPSAEAVASAADRQRAGLSPDLRAWAAAAVPLLSREEGPAAQPVVALTEAAPAQRVARPRRGPILGLSAVLLAGAALAALALHRARPEPDAKIIQYQTNKVISEEAAPPEAPEAPEPVAPLPAPRPAPPSRAPAPPAPALVSVDAAVDWMRLEAEGRSVPVPGEVPPGAWSIVASFPELGQMRTGAVTLRAGQRVTLVCDALNRCGARP